MQFEAILDDVGGVFDLGVDTGFELLTQRLRAAGLGNIMDAARSIYNATDQTRVGVNSDVDFHAEAPWIVFWGLKHIGWHTRTGALFCIVSTLFPWKLRRNTLDKHNRAIILM